MDTPRAVPPWERRQIHRMWWYCLHCNKRVDAMESTVKGHVKSVHIGVDGDPVAGEDYTNGDHLLILLDRWDEWSLVAVDRFVGQLASVTGADDVAFEVGEGVAGD